MFGWLSVSDPFAFDHEPRAGALPLQPGVGGHGRAVRERPHRVRRGARALERGRHGGEHALGLVLRRGRRLGRDQPVARGDDGVREGPSDVHPEQHGADATA